MLVRQIQTLARAFLDGPSQVLNFGNVPDNARNPQFCCFLQHVEEDSRTDRTRKFSRVKVARGDSSCLVILLCSFFFTLKDGSSRFSHESDACSCTPKRSTCSQNETLAGACLTPSKIGLSSGFQTLRCLLGKCLFRKKRCVCEHFHTRMVLSAQELFAIDEMGTAALGNKKITEAAFPSGTDMAGRIVPKNRSLDFDTPRHSPQTQTRPQTQTTPAFPNWASSGPQMGPGSSLASPNS